MKILFIEDDTELAEVTALNLEKDGLVVDLAHLGKEALGLLEDSKAYDAIVLDLNLPDIEGMELLKMIKSMVPEIPVLALTARKSEEEKVNGLRQGFDDYVTKPFSHHELAARLRVLYRSKSSPSFDFIKIGSLRIESEAQTVLKNGVPLKLTLTEFRLLNYLAQNKNQWVSKKELLETIWDMNCDIREAKLLTAISRLRKKLSDQDKKIIKTSRNGYFIGFIDA